MMKKMVVCFLAVFMTSLFVQAEETQSEEQIPVRIAQAGQKTPAEASLTKMVAYCFLIVLLGGGTIWYVRKSRKQSNTQAKATDIKILSQLHLAPKRQLTLIRVSGETLLIGVTEHQITMLKSLSLLDEEIPEELPKSFSKTMLANESSREEDEDFSISGIRDVVSQKLKQLRPLQ
jgi:flagellar protein FliO/FliZ